jgi:hypothetical protein
MKTSQSHLTTDKLPPSLSHPEPITSNQGNLFRVSLLVVIARLGVSPDELRRWHGRGWLSFDEKTNELLDEFDDSRILEIQIVRDVARSGLTDAPIEVLFCRLPKPFAFDPDRLVYSFRHGWVIAEPPVEVPDSSEVIEEHIDAWIAGCDRATLECLRDQISDAIIECSKTDAESE